MRPPFHAGHALGLGAALFPPIALYANLGVAPLFAAVSLLTLITWAGRRPVWADTRGPLLVLILALPVWALVSALWSITPGESVKTGVSLLGTCIGGAVIVSTAASMTARERETFISWIIWGGAFGFALMFIDLFFDGPVYRIFADAKDVIAKRPGSASVAMNAGGVAAALFAWCWAGALWTRYGRGVCIAGLVFAASAVAQTQAETPVIAFAAGGVAAAVFFMLSKISERRIRIVSAVLIAAFVLLLPAAVAATPHVYDILEPLGDSEFPKYVRLFTSSLFHRLAIWQAAVGHIAEAPLAGLGFDTARALYDSGDRIKHLFTDNVGNALLASNFEPIPLHPHNVAMQIRLELGLAGALIAAGLFARVFWSASAALNSASRFFTCAVFFSGLAAASVAFGAWQSWWLGALFMTAAFAAALAKTPPPPPSPAGDVQKQV